MKGRKERFVWVVGFQLQKEEGRRKKVLLIALSA